MTTLARSGMLLAVATTTANAFGYAVTLVLGRSLTRDDFGAVGALLNLVLIAAVPALALQLVAARRVARSFSSPGTPNPGRERRPDPRDGARSGRAVLVRTAWLLALAVAVLGTASAPLVATFLHLDGLAPALLATVLAVTGIGTGLAQGVMQGAERFPALSVTYLVSGSSRFVAGAVAGAVGWGQRGVLAATCAAALVTLVTAGALAAQAVGVDGARLRRTTRDALRGPVLRGVDPEIRSSLSSMAGLFVLLNLDLLLARHYLPRDASGLYASGAIFTKVAFWAPQFLATLLYPGLASPDRRHRSLTHGLVLTVLSGALLALGCLLWARPALRLAFGSPYLSLAPQLWVFAALGAVLSVVQLLVYARVAAGRGAWSGPTTAVAAGVWALVAWRMHHTVGDVAATMLGGALCLAAVGAVGLRHDVLGPASRPEPRAGLTPPVRDAA